MMKSLSGRSSFCSRIYFCTPKSCSEPVVHSPTLLGSLLGQSGRGDLPVDTLQLLKVVQVQDSTPRHSSTGAKTQHRSYASKEGAVKTTLQSSPTLVRGSGFGPPSRTHFRPQTRGMGSVVLRYHANFLESLSGLSR